MLRALGHVREPELATTRCGAQPVMSTPSNTIRPRARLDRRPRSCAASDDLARAVRAEHRGDASPPARRRTRRTARAPRRSATSSVVDARGGERRSPHGQLAGAVAGRRIDACAEVGGLHRGAVADLVGRSLGDAACRSRARSPDREVEHELDVVLDEHERDAALLGAPGAARRRAASVSWTSRPDDGSSSSIDRRVRRRAHGRLRPAGRCRAAPTPRARSATASSPSSDEDLVDRSRPRRGPGARRQPMQVEEEARVTSLPARCTRTSDDEVLAHGELGEQLQPLEGARRARAAPVAAATAPGDVVAVHEHLSAARAQQPGEHAEERRLARAVRPDEADDRASGHRERSPGRARPVRRSGR